MPYGRSAERPVDRFVRPGQGLLQIDLVISAELGRGLPVLITEAGPLLKVLPDFGDIEIIHVGHFNLEWNPLLLPLQKSQRGIRLPVVKSIGEKFGEGRVLRRHGDAQDIIFGIVLIAAPSQMAGEDPIPRTGLLHVKKKRIGAGLQVFAFNLYIVGKRNGRALIGSGAPWGAFGGSKTLIKKAVMHQFSPDMPCTVVGGRIMHVRTVVLDGNLYRPDPLGHFGLLVITIGRSGYFRCLLSKT